MKEYGSSIRKRNNNLIDNSVHLFTINVIKNPVKTNPPTTFDWNVSAVAICKYHLLVVQDHPHRHCRLHPATFVVASIRLRQRMYCRPQSSAPIWPCRTIWCHILHQSALVLMQRSDRMLNVWKTNEQTDYLMTWRLYLLSGNCIRLNISIIKSIATNGPRKQLGGGSCEHKAAKAGGCGNVPPANGCSPGNVVSFGLYGIICEKSGRGNWLTTSSGSKVAVFELTTPVFWLNCRGG